MGRGDRGGSGWGLFAALQPPRGRAAAPQELLAYFGAHVIPSPKITHAPQIRRWREGYQNKASSACEIIPPDASLRGLY